MSLKVCIIGFGSIGQKHYKILKSIKQVSEILIISKHFKSKNYNISSSLNDTLKFNPDYIVVASPTSDHYDNLKFFINHFENKKILVEKPLFNKVRNIKKFNNNKIFVGYNLRFHKVIKYIKEKLYDKKIFYVNCVCHSYLPNWRNYDYRLSSSAKINKGGGVLLDLSHEINYLYMFFRDLKIKHIISKKISNLEIDSEDFSIISLLSKKNININLSLNYFTKFAERKIHIIGENIEIYGDLLNNIVKLNYNKRNKKISFGSSDLNYTYLDMHKEILFSKKSIYSSNFVDGLETQKIIKKIRDFI